MQRQPGARAPCPVGDLYGFAPGSLNCSTVTITGSAPVELGVLSDEHNVVARIVGQKKVLHITVSANGSISATAITTAVAALCTHPGPPRGSPGDVDRDAQAREQHDPLGDRRRPAVNGQDPPFA